jgi:hypothetical protein
MDFVGELLKLLPITISIGVLMLTIVAYRWLVDPVTKKVPRWFLVIPFALGLGSGIPDYLMKHLGEVLTQPVWVTLVASAQTGFFYGAGAVGIWEVRKKLWPFEEEKTEAAE